MIGICPGIVKETTAGESTIPDLVLGSGWVPHPLVAKHDLILAGRGNGQGELQEIVDRV
jgi:hypothetical protein